MESEAHGGGATRAADEDAGAMGFAAGTARDDHGMPGGAGGRSGPGDPAGPGDAISPGVLVALATWLIPRPQRCRRVRWRSCCHSADPGGTPRSRAWWRRCTWSRSSEYPSPPVVSYSRSPSGPGGHGGWGVG